jgi:hypothetical protein
LDLDMLKGRDAQARCFLRWPLQVDEGHNLRGSELRAKTLRWRRSAGEEEPVDFEIYRGVR